jgi:hypothetical protein
MLTRILQFTESFPKSSEVGGGGGFGIGFELGIKFSVFAHIEVLATKKIWGVLLTLFAYFEVVFGRNDKKSEENVF